jgi:hypothetical protein
LYSRRRKLSLASVDIRKALLQSSADHRVNAHRSAEIMRTTIARRYASFAPANVV